MQSKKIRETKEQKKARLAEIERLFGLIRECVAAGEMEKALDIRAQADSLRIHWQ